MLKPVHDISTISQRVLQKREPDRASMQSGQIYQCHQEEFTNRRINTQHQDQNARIRKLG